MTPNWFYWICILVAWQLFFCTCQSLSRDTVISPQEPSILFLVPFLTMEQNRFQRQLHVWENTECCGCDVVTKNWFESYISYSEHKCTDRVSLGLGVWAEVWGAVSTLWTYVKYDVILFSAIDDIHEPSDQLRHERLVRDGLSHAVHRRPPRQLVVWLRHYLTMWQCINIDYGQAPIQELCIIICSILPLL